MHRRLTQYWNIFRGTTFEVETKIAYRASHFLFRTRSSGSEWLHNDPPPPRVAIAVALEHH